MTLAMGRLQRWIYRLLRLLVWIVAVAYLLLEAREVAQQRQLTQITVFAVLFLVASFQMSLARFLSAGVDPAESRVVLQASLTMFMASLFSVLDGALDHLLVMLPGGVASGILPALYLLGWLVNLLCVGLGLASMEVFLRFLDRYKALP
ncbi:MAG: hypothetical protein WCF98_13215 [Synechococcus sp. ELA057]